MNQYSRPLLTGLCTLMLTLAAQSAPHDLPSQSMPKEAKVFMVATAALISAPIWYRIGRWIKFNLKSSSTLAREAQELITRYHYRYEKVFNLLGTELDATQQSAAFKQAVLESHARYKDQEQGTLMESLRSADWLSSYGSATKYPFLHYENRLMNAMGWLTKYQRGLSSGTTPEIAALKDRLSTIINLMRASLTQLRTSYEYLQEKNQKEQDDRIRQIQAHQAQLPPPPQPSAPPAQEDDIPYYIPVYEPPPAYDSEVPPPAYDGPPPYSAEDPNKRD